MDEPVPTSETSKKIEAISKETVHHICSGQVVVDLAIAVKELVENSLDSGATTVDIKLTDYGKSCITVSDNGSGVLEHDFEELALKHHTSKLREFSDLTGVSTFGFRGEALSSLCALSELSIVTRHSSNEHGFKLEFDKNGVLQKKEACAREKGTTVHIKNIFKNLPVRAKEFQRNLKKEFTRTIQILYNYCLVSRNVKITCTNLVANKSSKLIVATTGTDDILKNISAVFGKKGLDGIMKIELEQPDEKTLEEYNIPNNVTLDFEWECYMSNCDHNFGRCAPDRQFFYVNGRPCELTKISKLINQTYHKYNNKQYPFVFLNLKLNQQCADVNVTPDKRTIFVTQEKLILAAIKYNITKTWDKTQGNFTSKTLDSFNFGAKRIMPFINEEPPAKKLQIFKATPQEKNTDSLEKQYAETNEGEDEMECEPEEKFQDVEKRERIIKTPQKRSSESCKDEREIEYVLIQKPQDVEMKISLASVKEAFTNHRNDRKQSEAKNSRVKYRVQLGESQGKEAEKELERELTKESFANMQILGQFNLGFIIARLEDDLFIIDQHASDEKFRFEKLSNETQLKTQKLIIPKSLNLSTLNETILLDHRKVFEDNGYSLDINPSGEQGHRVKLTGMPVSGGWQFGQEDIEELIFLIREGGGEGKGDNIIPRPSRVRQMLASRACRGAVMIGTALNNAEMQRLMTQMSQMQNPWNCPHGRPTIRHLISLVLINR